MWVASSFRGTARGRGQHPNMGVLCSELQLVLGRLREQVPISHLWLLPPAMPGTLTPRASTPTRNGGRHGSLPSWRAVGTALWAPQPGALPRLPLPHAAPSLWVLEAEEEASSPGGAGCPPSPTPRQQEGALARGPQAHQRPLPVVCVSSCHPQGQWGRTLWPRVPGPCSPPAATPAAPAATSLFQGGDTKLLVILCVSACQKHTAETLQSLGLEARARGRWRGAVRPPGPPHPVRPWWLHMRMGLFCP